MSTPARLPNKAGWALDEALQEHDPAIACLLDDLIRHLEHEREAARSRYDKAALIRQGDALLTVNRLQQHTGRLATLHRLARTNQYDRYEREV